MATALEQIEHIFILMMENRSFDHMLGYLDASNSAVVGITDAQRAGYANLFNAAPYAPAPRTDPAVPVDPLHEREDIRRQMRWNPGDKMMTGFVADYATVSPADPYPAGQYYAAAQVPMIDFLAREFCVCDHWFACLPASTQPNRLMAMSGYSLRDHTTNQLLDDQDVAYDWLDAQGVSWRVYSEGFPFFALMPKIQRRIVADVWDNLFRGLVALDSDCRSADTLPKVIFIEPQYTDGAEPDKADDDHPLTPITRGQDLLRRVYAAVTGNPQLWSKSILIVTYDEHGGFFDHVEPLPLVTPHNHGESYLQFTTTGVRVPAIVVSPFVARGSCFSQPLDHTSILKMLADKYTPATPYSDDVAARMPIHSAQESLTLTIPRPGAAPSLPPPPPPLLAAVAPPTPRRGMPSPNSIAFLNAIEELRRLDPQAAAHKYPAWKDYFLKGR
jgi:phospholipase C